MNQVWKKGKFKIYHADDSYILHNTHMDGFTHSHIRNFKTAVFIADLSEHKRIPHHLCRYLLISLLRVSDDVDYCDKIQELIDSKSNKTKQYYFNSQKGVSRRK